jgi:hypothetical protein
MFLVDNLGKFVLTPYMYFVHASLHSAMALQLHTTVSALVEAQFVAISFAIGVFGDKILEKNNNLLCWSLGGL